MYFIIGLFSCLIWISLLGYLLQFAPQKLTSYIDEGFYKLKAVMFPEFMWKYITFKNFKLVVWLLINFLVFWSNIIPLYVKSVYLTILSVVVYCLLIFFVLHGVGEWLIRKIEDVRRVATYTEKERLTELFEEVRETIGLHKVKLYIIDTMSVNALAIGKRTIAITRGLMNTMNDYELKGIIAHEFAHIYNGDTTLSMLITVASNIFLWGAILLSKMLLVLETLFGVVFGSVFGFLRVIVESFVKYTLFVLEFIIAGDLRKREYKADMFASKHGYNVELTSALYKLYSMQVSDKKDLIEQARRTHPILAYRIEKLEQMAV